MLAGSVGRGAVTGEPLTCRSDLEADGVEPGERVDEFAGPRPVAGESAEALSACGGDLSGGVE